MTKLLFYGILEDMLIQEPSGVKFEEKSLTKQDPVIMYRRAFVEDTVVRMHYHSSLEINVCTNVYGTIIVEGNKFPLNEYSLIFIKPNILHSYEIPANKGEMEIWHIGLSYFPFLDAERIESYLGAGVPVVLSRESEDSTSRLLNALFKEGDLLKSSDLLKLLDSIYKKARNQTTGFYRDEFLHKILSFVEEKFSSKISLNDAAAEVNLSRYYFCRKFKDKTGVTFNEYLNNLRMEKSIVRIHEGWSVSEAAWDSGFSDVSYYIKKFRSIYGVTPGELCNGFSELQRIDRRTFPK